LPPLTFELGIRVVDIGGGFEPVLIGNDCDNTVVFGRLLGHLRVRELRTQAVGFLIQACRVCLVVVQLREQPADKLSTLIFAPLGIDCE